MKLDTVKKYLEEKINNSWYHNARLDHGISGRFIGAQEEENNLKITWEESGTRYYMVINWYQEYSPEQLYNIWMEEEWEEVTEDKEQAHEEERKEGNNDMANTIYEKSQGDLFDTLANKYGEDMYFGTENVHVSTYNDRVYITDLTNAMKSGKECTRWCFLSKTWENPYNLWIGEFIEMATDCNSLSSLVSFLRNNSPLQSVDGLEYYKDSVKSNRVFSPFVHVHPIKTPKKWTVSLVAKAILSGQISSGAIEGIYTDDYAFDNSCDFQRGEMKQKDLFNFAQKLIETPRGWKVWSAEEGKEGKIKLNISCHVFDDRTLYFEKPIS